MSSSDLPLYRLTLEADEPGLGALVIDAGGHVVGRCADDQRRLELEVPRGLYTVRSSKSGAFAETVVRLDRPQTIRVTPPPVFSAAPLPNAATTHEYYTYPAWEASQTPTAPEQSWNGAASASLLLFARATQMATRDRTDQLSSLVLRTSDGRVLTEFKDDARRDLEFGWSAYSVRLSPGQLILEDRGERPRQIPVPAISGWQTQVFVMHHRRLLWEDVRLVSLPLEVIASRQHRDPYALDPDDALLAQSMDAGLLALQNSTPSVAPQLIDTCVLAKFQNPFLGLLGAYLLLLHEQRQSRNPEHHVDRDRIREVLDNLAALQPDSPDVMALRLMAKRWLGPPTITPVDGVPLFRCGAEELLRAAASAPGLLSEGSLLDAVSDRIYGDSAWTTWTPIPLPINTSIAAGEVGADSSNSVADAIEGNWVEAALIDAVSAGARRGESISADDIVRRIGVSPHAARDAMSRILSRAANITMASDVTLQGAASLLGSNLGRSLAESLGATIDEKVTRQITGRLVSDQGETSIPSIQLVYSRLKKALADVSDKQAGGISADSQLAEIMGPLDESGSKLLNKRLARHFREHKITLSMEELSDTKSVRDLAHLMTRKMSG